MKSKIDNKNGLDSILNSSFKRRDYYFHPDEDFREDLEWGKNKPQDPSHLNLQNKSSEKLITKG